jgi:hypothetical protein
LSYAIAGKSALVWNSGWVTNDGSTFTVIVPFATTGALEAGRYEVTRIWTGSGTYSGVKYFERLDPLTIMPDASTAMPGDRTTFAEINLAYVEAAISARLSGDEPEEYTIGGRSVRKMTLADLKAMRATLQNELFRLRHPGTGYASLAVTFTRPSL